MVIHDPDISLSASDISEVEADIGFSFPTVLREHYLMCNGGRPEPDIFNGPPYPAISELLPLRTKTDFGTAVDVYKDAVLRERLVPKSFFPFAIEGGGN